MNINDTISNPVHIEGPGEVVDRRGKVGGGGTYNRGHRMKRNWVLGGMQHGL